MGGLYDLLIAAGFGVLVVAVLLVCAALGRWLPARVIYFLLPVTLACSLISFVRAGWLSTYAAAVIGIVSLILLFREWRGVRDKAKITMPRS